MGSIAAVTRRLFGSEIAALALLSTLTVAACAATATKMIAVAIAAVSAIDFTKPDIAPSLRPLWRFIPPSSRR